MCNKIDTIDYDTIFMQNKGKNEKLPVKPPKPANLHTTKITPPLLPPTVSVVVADDIIASKVLYIQAIDVSVVHVFIL